MVQSSRPRSFFRSNLTRLFSRVKSSAPSTYTPVFSGTEATWHRSRCVVLASSSCHCSRGSSVHFNGVFFSFASCSTCEHRASSVNARTCLMIDSPSTNEPTVTIIWPSTTGATRQFVFFVTPFVPGTARSTARTYSKADARGMPLHSGSTPYPYCRSFTESIPVIFHDVFLSKYCATATGALVCLFFLFS